MISLNMDLGDILALESTMLKTIKDALHDAGKDLSTQAHAHLVEEVNKNLHSSRDKYLDALKWQEVSSDTWVISLDAKAMWIEEGMEQHSMLEDLLSGKAVKTAKDGSRYVIVPFKHNKGPSQFNPATASGDLTETIKKELKARKIPYGGLEMDSAGKPKLGLLHKLDITKLPTKVSEGVYQGSGPIGQVRQGPTGIPYLQGIRIYQGTTGIPLKPGGTSLDKGAGSKLGSPKVQKSIMTFRVASSKHMGTGRWNHPGLEPKHLFEATEAWAMELMATKIGPETINRILQTL
jgi:hypothetical protein